MFADSVITVRLREPRDFELIRKTECHRKIRTPLELIEDDTVVNPLDPHLPAVVLVKQLPPLFPQLRKADGANAEERFRAGEVDACFLLFRLDLEQDNVLRVRTANNRVAQQLD